MNNPKTRQKWILDQLKENPLTGFKEMFSVYFEKFSKSEVTFSKDWKKATERLREYQEAINAARMEASIKAETELVKRGLKTKIERLLVLQNLVNDCIQELATKKCSDTIVVDSTVKNIKRLMTQNELNQTRRTLKELQSEISKIEGDYAPAKQDVKTQGTVIIEVVAEEEEDEEDE